MAALGSVRREPCAKCNLPVFIAERLLVGGRKLYHRTCFRCARCQHQLSLANCYETEDGQYCCEACPDEVDANPVVVPVTAGDDEYSADFETVLESDRPLSAVTIKQDVHSSSAMSDFMIGQLQHTDEEVPSPHPPDDELAVDKVSDKDTCTLDSVSGSHVNSTPVSLETSESDVNSSVSKKSTYFFTKTSSPLADDVGLAGEEVPLIESSIKRSDSNQPLTANDGREDCIHDHNKLITKCTKESDEAPTSLVKMRMRMFDNDQRDELPKMNYTSRRSINLYSKSDESLENNALTLDPSKDVDVTPTAKMKEDNLDNRKMTSPVETGVTTQFEMKDDGTDSLPFENDKELNSKVVSEKLDKLEDIETREAIILTTKENETTYSDNNYICESKEELNTVDEDDKVVLKPQDETVDESVEVNFPDESLNKSIPSPVLAVDEVKVSDPITDDIITDKLETSTDAVEVSPRKDSKIVYPTDLNPFGDEESEGEEAANPPSTNPFGSSDEEEAPTPKSKPPRPPQPVSRQTLPARARNAMEVPKINVNPFWSDGEEPSSEDEGRLKRTPVPRPRTLAAFSTPDPSPVPRLRSSSGKFGSNNSLSSVDSSRSSTLRRKKKPAPPPPSIDSTLPLPDSAPPLPDSAPPLPDSAPPLPDSAPPLPDSAPPLPDSAPPLPDSTPPLPDSAPSTANTEPVPSDTRAVISNRSSLLPDVALSLPSSPNHSIPSSPKTLPRHRKARPAPPPPSLQPRRKLEVSPPIECEKFEKDEENRNRQSKTCDDTPFMIAANKSMYGQWKRKKGPAPPRPVPQRREIRAMPMKEVKRELDDIDVQQLELERQGVRLEKTIRSKCEDVPPVDDSGVTPDVEDMVLQLFEIVNEKNELFRRQAELMYLRRQHRLEEEHADLEYEIRCLLERPDTTKTDTDKAYEEELISRLVDVVERRDEIVNCLEMDRQREVEEDRSIHEHLATFTAKGKGVDNIDILVEASSTNTHKKHNTLKLLKKKVKKSKDKLVKKKEVSSVDADKDVDESDVGKQTKEKKSKHKWF